MKLTAGHGIGICRKERQLRNENEPMVRCGNALVVQDGSRRLIWKQISASRWAPRRLWPSATEATTVAEAICRGDPVLIILDRRPEPIHALVNELAQAPPEITDLVSAVSGDVAELRVPRLTWLPSSLSARGHAFLDGLDLAVRHTPALLLPALLLQPPRTNTDNVWFGLRARNTSFSIDELMAVIDSLPERPSLPKTTPTHTTGSAGYLDGPRPRPRT